MTSSVIVAGSGTVLPVTLSAHAAINADSVQLDNGAVSLSADLIGLGVGVRPAVALAEATGLQADNGVGADACLETAVSGFFAAGDIARYPDAASGEPIRVEHWVAAQRQGQAAARNILGRKLPLVDPPFFWTYQRELAPSYVGHATSWDEIQVDGDIAAGDPTVRLMAGGRTRAAITLGRDQVSLAAEAQMVSKLPTDGGGQPPIAPQILM